MSRQTQLRALVALHLLWTFLLTPIALEPRPFSSFNPLGFVSLALIFTTVALDIVSFVIVRGRPRTAGTVPRRTAGTRESDSG